MARLESLCRNLKLLAGIKKMQMKLIGAACGDPGAAVVDAACKWVLFALGAKKGKRSRAVLMKAKFERDLKNVEFAMVIADDAGGGGGSASSPAQPNQEDKAQQVENLKENLGDGLRGERFNNATLEGGRKGYRCVAFFLCCCLLFLISISPLVSLEKACAVRRAFVHHCELNVLQ